MGSLRRARVVLRGPCGFGVRSARHKPLTDRISPVPATRRDRGRRRVAHPPASSRGHALEDNDATRRGGAEHGGSGGRGGGDRGGASIGANRWCPVPLLVPFFRGGRTFPLHSPRMRCNLKALAPVFWLVAHEMAQNQRCEGVEATASNADGPGRQTSSAKRCSDSESVRGCPPPKHSVSAEVRSVELWSISYRQFNSRCVSERTPIVYSGFFVAKRPTFGCAPGVASHRGHGGFRDRRG